MSEDRGAGAFSPPGPEAALAELRRATALVTSAFAAAPVTDDVAAFGCVVQLDQALGQLSDVLRIVPGIVEMAAAGDPVNERLSRYQAELSRRQAEVAAAHADLGKLRDLEQEVEKTEAERNRLRDRIDELEHAHRIAAELPSLRLRLQALQAAVAGIDAADARDVTDMLVHAVGHLHAMTEQQRAVLGEQARSLIADAESAGQALGQERARRDAAAAELAVRSEEAKQVTAVLEEKLAILKAWHQADADLAEALNATGIPAASSALQRVRAELSALERRVAELDGQLRPVLAEHARAYEEATKTRSLTSGAGP